MRISYWFGIGLTFTEKRMTIRIGNVNMDIVSVNQMENGIVVNFEDGVCAFFDAAFLYAQMDKRLIADFGDTSSTPPRPGGNQLLLSLPDMVGFRSESACCCGGVESQPRKTDLRQYSSSPSLRKRASSITGSS